MNEQRSRTQYIHTNGLHLTNEALKERCDHAFKPWLDALGEKWVLREPIYVPVLAFHGAGYHVTATVELLNEFTPESKKPRDIKQELEICLEEVETLFDGYEAQAVQRGVNVYALQSRDGSYLVVPLLVAKAQLLSTLSEYDVEQVLEPIQGGDITEGFSAEAEKNLAFLRDFIRPGWKPVIKHFCDDVQDKYSVCGLVGDADIVWSPSEVTCFRCKAWMSDRGI